ncbi:MAG: tyrosine-protein phosphatase [Myxococcota bacterium]
MLIGDRVGPHERLPLRDEGLHGKPLGWARIRATGDALDISARLTEAGCRCTVHPGFLLVRTHAGERIEIEVPGIDGNDGPTAFVAAFAEAFDRAVHARRAGHSIACWQGTNDAIAALMRYLWAATGGAPMPGETFPPIRARLPRPLRETLAGLRAGLNLRDSLGDLRRLLVFAREAADWLGTPAATALSVEIERLAPALEADRFWNLRDVATWWAPHVRPGVLLRGRSPMAYSDEGFWGWAETNALSRFVDLRGPTERAAVPYPDDVAGCAACPLDLANPQGVAESGGLDAAYVHIVSRSAPALGALLEAIAADEGPVLIHCHAGVDRTGVLVALLGTWLGVPRARIEADYLASGQLVDVRRLAGALAAAETYGLARLVADTALPETTLTRARARLLP